MERLAKENTKNFFRAFTYAAIYLVLTIYVILTKVFICWLQWCVTMICAFSCLFATTAFKVFSILEIIETCNILTKSDLPIGFFVLCYFINSWCFCVVTLSRHKFINRERERVCRQIHLENYVSYTVSFIMY